MLPDTQGVLVRADHCPPTTMCDQPRSNEENHRLAHAASRHIHRVWHTLQRRVGQTAYGTNPNANHIRTTNWSGRWVSHRSRACSVICSTGQFTRPYTGTSCQVWPDASRNTRNGGRPTVTAAPYAAAAPRQTEADVTAAPVPDCDDRSSPAPVPRHSGHGRRTATRERPHDNASSRNS